jgi:TatD DNase family protein
VIHCFSGSYELAKNALDLGFFISISGIITFKKSDELREIVRKLPWQKLLVETDAPFLAPMPHRGKKCEPWMVTETGKFLSQYLGIDETKFAESTVNNTKALFQF